MKIPWVSFVLSSSALDFSARCPVLLCQLMLCWMEKHCGALQLLSGDLLSEEMRLCEVSPALGASEQPRVSQRSSDVVVVPSLGSSQQCCVPQQPGIRSCAAVLPAAEFTSELFWEMEKLKAIEAAFLSFRLFSPTRVAAKSSVSP